MRTTPQDPERIHRVCSAILLALTVAGWAWMVTGFRGWLS